VTREAHTSVDARASGREPGGAAAWAQGRTIVDSANRKVVLPEKISRVFVAGPPASVLVYVLAPDTMVGWIACRRRPRRSFWSLRRATCRRPAGSPVAAIP
jgi:hypothetical protein